MPDNFKRVIDKHAELKAKFGDAIKYRNPAAEIDLGPKKDALPGQYYARMPYYNNDPNAIVGDGIVAEQAIQVDPLMFGGIDDFIIGSPSTAEVTKRDWYVREYKESDASDVEELFALASDSLTSSACADFVPDENGKLAHDVVALVVRSESEENELSYTVGFVAKSAGSLVVLVLPEWRRKGIASYTLGRLKDMLFRARRYEHRVRVAASNVAAVGLMIKCRYSLVDVEQHSSLGTVLIFGTVNNGGF